MLQERTISLSFKGSLGRTENGICMRWSQDAKPAKQTSSCGLTEFELSDVESARDSCLEVRASLEAFKRVDGIMPAVEQHHSKLS